MRMIGPMLVAMLALLFFLFAAASAIVGLAAMLASIIRVPGTGTRLLPVFVFVVGCLGAGLAVVFGHHQQCNVVGTCILRPRFGYYAWAAVGFGWSSLAGLILGYAASWLPTLVVLTVAARRRAGLQENSTV
jgi:hypothetical protein